MKPVKKNPAHALIGFLFLIFAVFWLWFIAPKILQLPENFSFSSQIISTDDLFDEERNAYSGSVYSKSHYLYETLETLNGQSTIKNSFDVRSIDDEPIFSVERIYGIDRQTGFHVEGMGDKDRNGYLFAPKNLKKDDSFTYWHINYDAPAHMEYIGTEYLYELEVYHYETEYDGVTIDQTKELANLPEVGISRGVELDVYLELWVEPVTGRLVKYRDNSTAYYYDLESGERLNPWNHFSNTFDEKSVKANVEHIRIEKIKSLIVESYIPLLMILMGAWFLLIFFGLKKGLKKIFTTKRIGLIIALFLIFWPILNLIDWTFQLELLNKIASQKAKMNPLTGLCFMIMGVGIIAKIKQFKTSTIYLGLILITVSTLSLLNLFEVISLELGLILFSEQILATPSPARMGMFTGIGFFLIGLAFISSQFKRWGGNHIIDVYITITILFSLLILISYSLEMVSLLGTSIFYSVSSTTAFLFFIGCSTIFIVFRGGDKHTLKFTGWVMVSSILFISIFATVIATGIVVNNFFNESELRFENQVNQATIAIEDRLNIYINTLKGGVGFVNASESVERNEWKTYVDSLDLDKNYPGIQGVGYSIFVQPEDKASHVQSIRNEGFPDYDIKPEGERDLYTSIIYLEPFDERNQQAFGYDMFSNAIRRSAMEKARDSGEPKMSGLITLVQEIDDDVQAGFLIYVPAYKTTANQDLEGRRENILGYVYSAFRARNFVEAVIGVGGLKEIGLSIYDGTEQGLENELYNDTNEKISKKGQVASFNSIKTIYAAGRPWTLNFVSSPGFGLSGFNQAIPIIIILAGIIISFLITLAVYTLASSRQKSIAYGKRLTENLRKEKAKDEAILASIGEGLIVVNEQGKIALVNKAFEVLIGWKAKEVHGKSLTEVIPMLNKKNEEIPKSKRLINKALKKRFKNATSAGKEIYYKRKNGSKFPVFLTVSPIMIDNKFMGVVEVFRDITKEREIDEAKTEFVSLASHQLRTPLTAIKLFSELLSKDKKYTYNRKQKDYFHNIQVSTGRMIQLVNDLLNVSRLESGKMSINPENTNLKTFIRSTSKSIEAIAKKKKIKYKLDFPQSDLNKVLIDQALFHEVLICFLSNAVRYTPAQGSIEISLRKDKKQYLIAIKDSGIGIPKKAQANIFKKFFRADNAVKTEADGSGLGLYIAHMIMEASGGKVWFKSSEKGSTFYISIPLKGMKIRKGEKKIAQS